MSSWVQHKLSGSPLEAILAHMPYGGGVIVRVSREDASSRDTGVALTMLKMAVRTAAEDANCIVAGVRLEKIFIDALFYREGEEDRGIDWWW